MRVLSVLLLSVATGALLLLSVGASSLLLLLSEEVGV